MLFAMNGFLAMTAKRVRTRNPERKRESGSTGVDRQLYLGMEK
jgi:hypothetical protein